MRFLIKWLGGYTKAEFNEVKAPSMQELINAATQAADVRDLEWSPRMAKQEKDFLQCRIVTLTKARDSFLELAEFNKAHKYKASHIYKKASRITAQILDIEGSIQIREKLCV